MDALWIAAALVVAVMGGWPVTAGLLKLAKSKTVRAVDAAESGQAAAAARAAQPDSASSQQVADVGTLDRVPCNTPPLPKTAPTVAAPVAAAPVAPTAAPDTAPETTPTQPELEVLRGGLLIGFLERAAVAVAIFTGQPIAVAYVVAIKGLGRYPELKDTPAASERFIIGTLASMLWSASVAALTKALLL